MKFYNPFKPHIVTCGDNYLVRKLSTVAWMWLYKETQTFRQEEPFWWSTWDAVNKHCMCNSLAQAIALRDKVWVDPKKKPKVKMKVING